MTNGNHQRDTAGDGPLAALRARQQREAGRGCLLALVLDAAAILAALLWLASAAWHLPRLRAAAGFAFLAFTLAAAAAGLILLVQGNLPSQRRLRRAADGGEAAASTEPKSVAPGSDVK